MKLSEKLAALEKEEASSRKSSSDDDAAPSPGVTKKARPKTDRPKTAHRAGNWDATKKKVRELVLNEVAPKMKGLTAEQLATEVKGALDRILQREDVAVTPLERRRFVQEMMADTLGYGPLDPILGDDSVTEVMCNAYDDIWVERNGRVERTDLSFTDDDQYRAVIDKIVSAVGRRVDEASPMVDARLPDGSRVNAIIPPLALHGAVLTIRKFAQEPYTAKDLINFGTWTIDLVTIMEACVKAKLNILVSGGTGTGKTTNLNVLSAFIPEGERVITIEDSAELQLQQPHVINLETRPMSAEGTGLVTIRDLVKNALRMRPDRIIIGECRAAETLDMLQAMNTGHEGSMTTVHANSSRDAISRLETMVLMAGFDLPMRAIREQIASAIDLILQVSRMPDGRRVITAVTEVQGLEGEVILLQDIFKYRTQPGKSGNPVGELVPTGLRPKFMDTLAQRNIEVPAATLRAPTAGSGGARLTASSRSRKPRSVTRPADQDRRR